MQQVVELFSQSPSRKELHDAAHNDRVLSFVMEDVLSPYSSQLTNSFESFSALKRTREDMIQRDSDFSEMDRNRSPKHHRSAGCDSEFFSEPPNESNPETSALGRETRLEHWADASIFAAAFVMPSWFWYRACNFSLSVLAESNMMFYLAGHFKILSRCKTIDFSIN